MFSYIDNLFGDIEQLMRPISNATQTFPSYNIYHVKDTDNYVIEMAIAGYSKDMVDVDVTPSPKGNVPVKTLTITGKASKPSEDHEYYSRGITSKEFTQKFYIYDSDIIESCSLENGILRIVINRNTIKEEKQKIEVK